MTFKFIIFLNSQYYHAYVLYNKMKILLAKPKFVKIETQIIWLTPWESYSLMIFWGRKQRVKGM